MPVPRPATAEKPKPENTGTTDTTDTGGNRGTRGGNDSPPERRPPRKGSLEYKLTEFLSSAAALPTVAGDSYSAAVITMRAPLLAAALADLADENASVKRMLSRMLEGSAWGAVAIATLAIVIPIAQAHNVLPGMDPFSLIYGPVPGNPRQRNGGRMTWSTTGNDPSGTGAGSAMGAPAPPDPDPVPYAGTAPDFTPTVPGAPPGVVTVPSGVANGNNVSAHAGQ